jgi:hypothetical protein
MLIPEYQYLTTDEVLRIASQKEQLTDEARMTLETELARRKLSDEEVQSYKVEYLAAERVEKARSANRIFGPSWSSHRGIGFKFLGKSNGRRDPSGRFEEYESTQWFIIFSFPVFPVATFTVRRVLSRRLGIVFKSEPHTIQRHPRNWEQILATWIKAVLILWAILLMLRHPEWLIYLFQRVKELF